MASIRFMGAAGTVTGSRFLVESGSERVLVDAGLFQGPKPLRLRNREPWPVPPASIGAVVLTHAHIDHSGALPLLARQGFRGPVHCTPATRDLCALLLPDPEPGLACDALVVESTYGGRRHEAASPAAALRDEVNRVVGTGGALLVPAFAIGRTQEVLFALRELEDRGEIPRLPVFVDSPMAVDATPIYLAHREDHDDDMARRLAAGEEPLRPARLAFARSPEQSKAINDVSGPCIILSASGMATGGRVLHHLARRLPDPRTTVLLVGYQAGGTRGWSLLNGAATLRVHGEDVPVRARVATITGFSAHADEGEVSRWLATFPSPPRHTFLVHGEPAALQAAQARMDALGWPAHAPAHLEEAAP